MGGFLKRSDESEAALAFLRVMAQTPYRSWAGCSSFGLRELLEQASVRADKIQLAIEESNRALENLGITAFRIEKVVRESAPGEETSRWIVTLAAASDPAKAFSLRWSGTSQ